MRPASATRQVRLAPEQVTAVQEANRATTGATLLLLPEIKSQLSHRERPVSRAHLIIVILSIALHFYRSASSSGLDDKPGGGGGGARGLLLASAARAPPRLLALSDRERVELEAGRQRLWLLLLASGAGGRSGRRLGLREVGVTTATDDNNGASATDSGGGAVNLGAAADQEVSTIDNVAAAAAAAVMATVNNNNSQDQEEDGNFEIGPPPSPADGGGGALLPAPPLLPGGGGNSTTPEDSSSSSSSSISSPSQPSPLSASTALLSSTPDQTGQQVAVLNQQQLCEQISTVRSGIPSISVRLVFFSLYGLIFAIGLLGNTLTLYAMRRKREKSSIIDIFIANLALSDIMLCIFAVPITPIYMLHYGHWVFGPGLCKAFTFAQGSSVYISTFTMISIAQVRYQLIVHPLHDSMSKLTALLLNLCTWILGFLVTLPYLMHVGLLPENCAIKFCDEHWDEDIDRFWFSVITLMLQFFLPFTAVSYFYGSIFWKLRLQKRRRQRERPNAAQMGGSGSGSGTGARSAHEFIGLQHQTAAAAVARMQLELPTTTNAVASSATPSNFRTNSLAATADGISGNISPELGSITLGSAGIMASITVPQLAMAAINDTTTSTTINSNNNNNNRQHELANSTDCANSALCWHPQADAAEEPRPPRHCSEPELAVNCCGGTATTSFQQGANLSVASAGGRSTQSSRSKQVLNSGSGRQVTTTTNTSPANQVRQPRPLGNSNLQPTSSSPQQQQQQQQQQQMATTKDILAMKELRLREKDKRLSQTNRKLLFMVVLFVFSWLPLNMFNLVQDYSETISESAYIKHVFLIVHLIACSSVCYNPILYAWMSDNYRQELRDILPTSLAKKCCCLATGKT